MQAGNGTRSMVQEPVEPFPVDEPRMSRHRAIAHLRRETDDPERRIRWWSNRNHISVRVRVGLTCCVFPPNGASSAGKGGVIAHTLASSPPASSAPGDKVTSEAVNQG